MPDYLSLRPAALQELRASRLCSAGVVPDAGGFLEWVTREGKLVAWMHVRALLLGRLPADFPPVGHAICESDGEARCLAFHIIWDELHPEETTVSEEPKTYGAAKPVSLPPLQPPFVIAGAPGKEPRANAQAVARFLEDNPRSAAQSVADVFMEALRTRISSDVPPGAKDLLPPADVMELLRVQLLAALITGPMRAAAKQENQT